MLENDQRIPATFATPKRPQAVRLGSIKAVIADYEADGEFDQRAKTTKKNDLRYVSYLETNHGHLTASKLHRTTVLPTGGKGHALTVATRLRELGWEREVIASITGHDTAAMVEHYSESERTAKLEIDRLNAATLAGPAQKMERK